MNGNTAIVHLECSKCEEPSKYPRKAFKDPELGEQEPEVGDTVGAHECECGDSIHIITEVSGDE